MNAQTTRRVDPPLSPLHRVARGAALGAAALALALGFAACNDATTNPQPTSYITLDAQRAESQASSFSVSLQLDRATYDAGDTLSFAMAIHNNSGVHTSLGCGFTTTQRYDFIVRDSTAHQQVWRYSTGRVFPPVGGIQFDPDGGIADGDSVVYEEIWTQDGQDGVTLVGGHLYSVTAYPLCVLSRITPPSVTFTTRSGS